MFDDLEHYLSTLIPRERVDTVLNILNHITVLVGPEPTSSFAQYSLGVPVDVDPMDEIARFDDAIENLIISALGELGITLDEDQYDSGKLPVIDRLLFAIQQVEEWQDAERLMALMVESDDHEMAIAEIAAEINDDDYSQYALLLATVSNDFYENLLNLVQQNAEADVAAEALEVTAPWERIKTHFDGRAESFVSRAIRENTVTLGMEYEFYLKFYENYLWDLTPELLVNALIDFAICSKLPDGEVGVAAQNEIGKYAESIEQAQTYRQLMDDVVRQLPEKFKQSTVETN